MLYLIYASKEAAIERADEEGKEIGFDYWVKNNGVKAHAGSPTPSKLLTICGHWT
jgi:hypothetical protein